MNPRRLREDAQDSFDAPHHELRGVAPPIVTKSNGIQISPIRQVDEMKIDDSSPEIPKILFVSMLSPTIKEFIQQRSYIYSKTPIIWHKEDEQSNLCNHPEIGSHVVNKICNNNKENEFILL